MIQFKNCGCGRPAARVAACLSVALMSACGSARGTSAPLKSDPSPAVSATLEGQVLAAWRAEHLAYADALRALNPRLPALAQTAIDPALGGAVAFIAVSKAEGVIVHGTQDLGSPTVLSLTPSAAPTTAVVRGCIHDGLVLVNGTSGKALPGPSGQVTWARERTTLTLVSGIGWMVSENSVKQDLSRSVCAGS